MYALLLVPPARDVDAAARELAALIGAAAYDQRQLLLRGLPWLAGWTDQLEPLRQNAARLRAVGVEAWPMARAALELPHELLDVRKFALSQEGLAVADRGGQGLRARWSEVGAVLPCRADAGQSVTTVTTTKKTSAVKLAMGVPVASKKVESDTSISQDSSFFCLLWLKRAEPHGGDAWLRFDSDGLDYSGLGQGKTASSTSNYLQLLQWLGRLAPHAWDPRLERAGGRIAPIPLPPRDVREQVSRSVSVASQARAWDTESAVLQAARLLVLAARMRAVAQAQGLS